MSPKHRSIYISARHMRRDELLPARELLDAAGIEVTSRWLVESRPEGAPATWIATISREDIERAEAFALYGDDRGDSGHRHVEFGIAMGLGKALYIVAPESENIWQRLPGVTVVASWQALRDALTD